MFYQSLFTVSSVWYVFEDSRVRVVCEVRVWGQDHIRRRIFEPLDPTVVVGSLTFGLTCE